MTATSTLLTALIAAATALVVAVLTQVFTWRREQANRTYERRRSALLDAQDAALILRNRFGEFGDLTRRNLGLRPGPEISAARRRVDDALAGLAVRLARVDDRSVVEATEQWQHLATYHSISSEEVNDEEETSAWTVMNARYGAALKSATGTAALNRAPTPGSTARS